MSDQKRKLSVRVNEFEYAHLKRQAQITGLKIEPFIRSLIMHSQLRPHPPDEYANILRELSAIGNNVNQIARVANSLGRINDDELQKIQLSLDRIWKEVKKM